MCSRKRPSSWLRVNVLGTATISASRCMLSGRPVFNQRRNSGGEEEYTWSHASAVDLSAISGISVTRSPDISSADIDDSPDRACRRVDHLQQDRYPSGSTELSTACVQIKRVRHTV